MVCYYYLDNAATTRVLPEVVNAMKPYFSEKYGNPSSAHMFGMKIKDDIDDARQSVANLIGAKKEEIYFTSGGSESNNWAIKGVAFASYKPPREEKQRYIITTNIEHASVKNTVKWLEEMGIVTKVLYLHVDNEGRVKLDELNQYINQYKDEIILISVMYANNEIGTIQPISEIGKIAREHKILFHTDAVQAVGNVKIDVHAENIDLLSLSSHKINGPKGVGALYIRKGIAEKNNIESLIHGGGQESAKKNSNSCPTGDCISNLPGRAGTENVPGIIGLGMAAKLATDYLKNNGKYTVSNTENIRNCLIDKLTQIPNCRINGSRQHRLPNNVNISFKNVHGSALLKCLEAYGIYVSSGSACSSSSNRDSHVLTALYTNGKNSKLSEEDFSYVGGTIRITIGKDTDLTDIDYIVCMISNVIKILRYMSPFEEIYSNNDYESITKLLNSCQIDKGTEKSLIDIIKENIIFTNFKDLDVSKAKQYEIVNNGLCGHDSVTYYVWYNNETEEPRTIDVIRVKIQGCYYATSAVFDLVEWKNQKVEGVDGTDQKETDQSLKNAAKSIGNKYRYKRENDKDGGDACYELITALCDKIEREI